MPPLFSILVRRSRPAWKLLLVCGFLAWFPAQGSAQARRAPEFQIKATLLINFGRFVEWPQEAASEGDEGVFTIGILGEDPFGEELDALQNEAIRGHQVRIHRFSTLEELEWTHILFVSESERDRIDEILRVVGVWPTLTVSDVSNFVGRGGIIRFTREGQTIAFEVNRDAALRARLQISAHLLRVAKGTPERPEVER